MHGMSGHRKFADLEHKAYTGTALLEIKHEQEKAGMSTIRFLADSRHGDWSKGQHGTVVKTLAVPPQNQFALYIIELENDSQVWATSKDVEPWNQLSLL